MWTLPIAANQSAAEIQKKAFELREQGQTLQAIVLYDQALDQFQKENNYNGMFGVINGRLIAWKHLYYETEEPLYALFVKQHVEALQFLVQHHGLADRQALVSFQLGTAHTQLKEYKEAEIELSKALQLYPRDDAEKGDWLAHLGFVQYLNGKKELGKANILEGISRIKAHASTADSFRLNVWLSGAYLRLAVLLQNDDPALSRSYTEQAEALIKANPDQAIRSRQLSKWKKQLSS
ncbi:MAG: hypothetical protein LLG04_17255 [Parachlamydia sp.]|nr:hypothetical protein [Parachlamydia sp.]